MLLCDDRDEGVQAVLEASNVVESPGGCVPRLNPDRTVSAEVRAIHDMKASGEHSAGDKYDHPPAD